MEPAKKDSANPFFKSSYADLEAVISAVHVPFKNNSLCFTQGMIPETKCLATRIIHASGQWLETYYPLDCKDWLNPQSVGSAVTYAKRYGLQAAAGLPTTDDDGNAGANAESKSSAVKEKVKASIPDEPLQEYKITFGQYSGKKLEEINKSVLLEYVDFLEGKARKERKEIQGKMKDFIMRVYEHCAEETV